MKLLIVDDHPTMRAGLAALLGHVEAHSTILEASNGQEALTCVAQHPDLDAAFVDLYMPGMDGMLLIQELVRHDPQLPVIVLSSSESAQDVRRALALGALGYLPKSASAHTILSAFRLVLSGDIYVPPFMLDFVTQDAAPHARQGSSKNALRLTARQLEVLLLLRDGLVNKEIGRRLGLSDKTVKAHVASLFKELRVNNRVQAVSAARQAGLITDASTSPKD
ncbi:response regulator [Undibacterium sp. Ji50W]|uniref:response regulator n=1 Tax=Undibacterium sp. Ji50W TaxID=3413041 RepID=UPI003BF279F7